VQQLLTGWRAASLQTAAGRVIEGDLKLDSKHVGAKWQVGVLGAAAAALVTASAAWACTLFQGTLTVCGNVDYTKCVTATGHSDPLPNGSRPGMVSTASGATAATSTNGGVKVSATGLNPAYTYDIRFADPQSESHVEWCLDPTNATVQPPSTGKYVLLKAGQAVDANGNFGPVGPLTLPSPSPQAEGAVCVVGGGHAVGNEAPISII
jgi:hypothetical protein